MNRDIAWLTEGYTKQDIDAAMNYFRLLREDCQKIMEERLWYSTAPELLTSRICSMIIDELWLCRRAKDDA